MAKLLSFLYNSRNPEASIFRTDSIKTFFPHQNPTVNEADRKMEIKLVLRKSFRGKLIR